MLKYPCSRKRAQLRLVNLKFGVVCVTCIAGMAAIEFSMRRGSTPRHPEGFGEGELAGREPGYRLSRRRGVMPLLLFCQINRSYIFRRALDVSEIAEMFWMPRRHEKRKSQFSGQSLSKRQGGQHESEQERYPANHQTRPRI